MTAYSLAFDVGADPRPPGLRLYLVPEERRTHGRWIRGQLAARDGACCAWCDTALRGDRGSIEHLLSRDNPDHQRWAWRFLVLACQHCNTTRRHASMPPRIQRRLERGRKVGWLARRILQQSSPEASP